jgi:predicted nuclease of restriction endonuclease-like RecB superfamily
MATKDITKKDLEQLQENAVKRAIRENKALGLSYKIVKNGQLMEVSADGERKVIGTAKYGTVIVKQKKIKLK